MTALLVALAVVSAGLAAASMRLPSLVSTVLAGYLALVANLAGVTWALSPFDAVTRTGLTVAEAILVAAAAAAWWLRGRPGVELAGLRTALRVVARDPVTLLFLGARLAVLGYELMLALEVPPNNWDSLAYHLSRAADWKQTGGIHWIANAPTGRMNEFQPLAEQQILYLMVAAGSGALFALPQFVAELAILVAVYGGSRRLGFDQRAAARGAAVLATFSAIALQSSTAQNDLVAASFPVAAACLLLGGGELEATLAGVALGLGIAAKLTTGLVWPIVAWLAWMGGRRALRRTAWGAAGGFLAVGVWGFVLNLVHTGHVLGHGQGRVEESVSPSVVGVLHTSARLLYRTLDLGLLSNQQIWGLAAAGAVAGIACAVLARRSGGPRAALLGGAAVALPLVTPLLVLGLAPVVAWITRIVDLPVHDPIYGFNLNRDANEDFSAFGAIGALAMLGVPAWVVARHRADRRQLALALALPTYLLLLGLYAKYNVWLTRFLIVPVVLAAPLFARLVNRRLVALGVLVVAGWTVFYALEYNDSKPLVGRAVVHLPWQLSQADALSESPAQPSGRRAAAGIRAYERVVPANACVGAVIDPDEWSYLLWGPKLERRVLFLPSLTALGTAYRYNVPYVVVTTGMNAPILKQFTAAGWKVEAARELLEPRDRPSSTPGRLPWLKLASILQRPCGCSSVGRARPCQGRGRGFEPHHPLRKAMPAGRFFSARRP